MAPSQPPQSDGSDGSDRSAQASESPGTSRLRPSGGYRALRSFRTVTIIYDATVSFCERFLEKRSRTIDQMVQAARSGRQNIAEGSRASGASSQTELRLVGVARASLDELLLDYEDFLRQRGLPAWTKDDREALAVRTVGRALDRTTPSDHTEQSDRAAYARWIDHRDPAIVANTLICLIHQANYLLDQQIAALERDFISRGGYTEQLAAARIAHRQQQLQPRPPISSVGPASPPAQPPSPSCPQCGKPMLVRTARTGRRAGSQFWGCSAYPNCKTTQPL